MNDLIQRLKQLSNEKISTPDIETHLIQSAVLIPIISVTDPRLILTKRTDHLPSHTGQISLPGGTHEIADKTLLDTALRETHEEIGLHKDKINIIAELEKVSTLSNYAITPYLGLIEETPILKVNANEVAQIINAPLSHFLDITNYSEAWIKRNNKKIRVYKINFEEHLIWGATAKILYQLAELT